MINTVIISNLRFYAFHGVLSQEKSVGHNFIVSLRIDCDFSQAVLLDKVAGTIDYGLVVEIVKKEMAVRSKLMEHLAGRVLYALFNKFPQADKVSITIMKENPPVNADSEGCGIEINATRDEFLAFYS